MKKLLLVTAVASAFGGPAMAADSPHTVTGNLSFVSDYRFRGLSQTFKEPAVQGGIDYSHASGLYLGTWASNVSGLEFNNGSGMEWDMYGGYKLNAGPIGLDLGLLYYYYPGAYYSGFGPSKPKYNNTEIYIGATWNWLSAKYSITTSDFFGVNKTTYGGSCGITSTGAAIVCTDPLSSTANSKGSGYLDLTATFPVAAGFNLIGHYGKQTVKNFGNLSYSDYKLGVTYDALGFTWGAAYTNTNAKEQFYRVAQNVGNPKDISGDALVLSVAKTF